MASSGRIPSLAWDPSARIMMWAAFADELLNSFELELRQQVSAWIGRKMDAYAIAEQAKRDVIRGLMRTLHQELEEEEE